MVALNSTSLGDQASTKRLITQDVSALNYQQPFLQLGTLASPRPAAASDSLAYVAGYNKYILYILGPATTAAILTNFTVTGTPIGLAGNSTISGSAEWILSGPTPTATVIGDFISPISVLNDTNSVGSVILRMEGVVANPQFSSGTAILKLVININLD